MLARTSPLARGPFASGSLLWRWIFGTVESAPLGTGLLESRANTCYVGITYTGMYTPKIYVAVNGSEVTSQVLKNTFQIVLRAGQPSQCRFGIRGINATPGQSVEVRDGSSGGTILFSGRLLSSELTMRSRRGIQYEMLHADNSWFVDRFNTVTRNYYADESTPKAVNGIVADILATFADGVRPGHIDGALTVTQGFTFDNRSVLDALRTIAAAVNRSVVITPHHAISFLQSVSDGHPINLTDSAVDFWDFQYQKDLSQVRTRVNVRGIFTPVAVRATTGATSVTVEDASAFRTTTSARLLARGVSHIYTGVTLTTNEDGTVTHTITGLSPALTQDLPIGTRVYAHGLANDPGAQGTLATTLGGGASGIVTHWIVNPSVAPDEAQTLADAQIGRLGTEQVRLRYTTRNKFTVPLKVAGVTFTTPPIVSQSNLIQRVVITADGGFASGTPLRLTREVEASELNFILDDILVDVLEPELS